jgi:hypothetical protein
MLTLYPISFSGRERDTLLHWRRLGALYAPISAVALASMEVTLQGLPGLPSQPGCHTS